MQWLVKILFASLLISYNGFSMAAVNVPSYEMMLIGSDFQLCRSSATTFCSGKDAAVLIKNSRTAVRYKLEISQIEKMMDVELWRPARQALRYDLHLLFNAIVKKTGTKIQSYAQLLSAWKSTMIKRDGKSLSGHSLFLSLSIAELTMILDHLEYAQYDYSGRRIKEKIQLGENQSTPTLEFAKKIVSLTAKDAPPNILIATLGNRDSFKDVDIYIDLFNKIGANATWLPLDAAVNKVMTNSASCNNIEAYRSKLLKSYDRRRVYKDLVNIQRSYCTSPAKFSDAIKAADALVIVGEHPQYLNQSLLGKNKKDSDLLALIHTQMELKKLLVVAIGNMAKGLVSKNKKGAVIIGGTSEQAMLNGSLTYQAMQRSCKDNRSCNSEYDSVVYQQGGIGLLDFPIIDTEVSSRGNIARLAKVSLDSKSYRSMSIDKNTAVLVNKGDSHEKYTVLGRQGIMYLENSPENEALTDIKYHYFTPDDQLLFTGSKMTATFPDWKAIVKDQQADLAHYSNLFYSDSFKRFSEQACVIAEKKWTGIAGRKMKFMVELSKTDSSELHMGGLKQGDSYQFYCTINSLLLTLKRN